MKKNILAALSCVCIHHGAISMENSSSFTFTFDPNQQDTKTALEFSSMPPQAGTPLNKPEFYQSNTNQVEKISNLKVYSKLKK